MFYCLPEYCQRIEFLRGGCFSDFIQQVTAEQQSPALKDETVIA